MKAAVLEALGTPLVVKDVPEPVLGTGEVLVDMHAARVLAYAADVFSGQRQYLFTPPVIPGPGGVGRVAALGPDATELTIGDWVICDPTVRARDAHGAPTVILQGLTAGDARGRVLQTYVPDGSWAERVRVPTENAIRLGAIDESEAPAWATLGTYLVPYGGFAAAGLRAGEVVVVNGATGSFGSAAVAVALSMGAACVLATGRDPRKLEALARRLGPRVRPVVMAVDEEQDRRRILDAAAGPIDCVLDLLPPAATAAQVRAALMTVRAEGRVVLMGGVREELPLPYGWLMRNGISVLGQWMYRRDAVARVVAMVRAGLLDIHTSKITCFDLVAVNAAVAHAAAHAGPFEATVLRPR